MTLPALYLGAVWATVRRDIGIFASYRLRIVSQVVGLLLSLTTFYYIAKLVRPDAAGTRGHYYAFAAIGIVIVAILTAALTTSQSVRAELMQGNFERVLISPLGPVGGTVSMAVFPIAWATALATLMLVLAVTIFSLPLSAAGIPPSLLVASLGALAFAAIGFLFVAALLAFKSASGAVWVIALLALLGGAYFPVSLLPGWARWVSEIQPFTPSVDLLRHFLVGTPSLQPVWLEFLKLGAFAAVLMPLSLTALWAGLQYSRRRGTIMEF